MLRHVGVVFAFTIGFINTLELEKQSYYEVLGIGLSASQADVKKAYRQLVIELHPDKIPINATDDARVQAKDQFLACQEAYETLFDPFKRSQYNAILEGNDQHYNVEPDRYSRGHFLTKITTRRMKLSIDIQFSDEIKIAEIPITLNVPLSEIFTGGVQRNATYFYRKTCPICHGNGGFEGVCHLCTLCNGKGVAVHKYSHSSGNFQQETTTQCIACNGRGCTIPKRCTYCGGSGTALTEAWLLVDIPKGFKNKQQFVYPNMGHDSSKFQFTTDKHASDDSVNNKQDTQGSDSDSIPSTTTHQKSGDVVVELVYEMPTSDFSLVEDRPYDLMYNTTVNMNDLVREDYALSVDLPWGEHVQIKIPTNTSLFSDLLQGYSETLTGYGFYKNIQNIHNSSVSESDTPLESNKHKNCENICIDIDLDDNAYDTSNSKYCCDDSTTENTNRTEQSVDDVSTARGDLIVNIEPSFESLDNTQNMHTLLATMCESSGVSASDPLYVRFFDIIDSIDSNSSNYSNRNNTKNIHNHTSAATDTITML